MRLLQKVTCIGVKTNTHGAFCNRTRPLCHLKKVLEMQRENPKNMKDMKDNKVTNNVLQRMHEVIGFM